MIFEWLNARFPLKKTWDKYVGHVRVANNLNAWYCLGAIALFLLLSQCFTGLWLAFFYTPTAQLAFHSVETIMRDVSWGWLLRDMHVVGASCFFMVLYLHLFRGLLYGSYQKPRELVWLLGMGLFSLMMAEAILGYVLPWGQVSYWGAQVMTALVGAIPVVGQHLLLCLRGDYSVSGVTLHRFFALHVIAIPALIGLGVYLHIVALHHVGSNNPDGLTLSATSKRWKAFYPYYVLKDLTAIVIFLFFFLSLVFFLPQGGGLFLDPLNHEPANPLITPADIHPAWYVMPFYAMLRVIPDQGMGLVVVSSAWLLLFFLPWLDQSPVRSMRYKGVYSRSALALWTLSVCLLGYLGEGPLTPLRMALTRGCILSYFAYFLLMPLYTRWERCKPLPYENLSDE